MTTERRPVIVVTEQIPGWYFCEVPEAVELAGQIGLPLWVSASTRAVCLPICYRAGYERTAAEAGVELVWTEPAP